MSAPGTVPQPPPRVRARARAAAAYAAVAGSREDVLRRHLPLVRRVVQRVAARKPPHIEVDDLVSWGIVGLLDAISKYDPKKEASFSTYAQFRIRGAVLDHLRSLDWVPRSVRQKASLIEKVSHALEGTLGRPPTEEEIAEELGLSLDAYQELLTQERVGLVADAIKDLPEREQLVVTLYYHEELTMKEVGGVLGLTESRVSQLHSQAMLRLKGHLTSHFGAAGKEAS